MAFLYFTPQADTNAAQLLMPLNENRLVTLAYLTDAGGHCRRGMVQMNNSVHRWMRNFTTNGGMFRGNMNDKDNLPFGPMPVKDNGFQGVEGAFVRPSLGQRLVSFQPY